MRVIQFIEDGQLCVGVVAGDDEIEVSGAREGVYGLALQAAREGVALEALVRRLDSGRRVRYQSLVDERRLLPPVTHPDAARMLISGTGLTHLGSAASRDAMHAKLQEDTNLTDSMKMFKLGVEGGKPAAGQAGAQPEWFYKGDGSLLVAPECDFPVPGFALDAGEEPELVGVYVIDDQGAPRRIGLSASTICGWRIPSCGPARSGPSCCWANRPPTCGAPAASCAAARSCGKNPSSPARPT